MEDLKLIEPFAADSYPDYQYTHLLADETERVTGVQAVNKLGHTESFTAKMGIIMATGGYNANAKMIQANNTSGKWDFRRIIKTPTPE